MNDKKRQKLQDIYTRLLSCYGPQQWWPGDGPFEVIVGAILTQSAAWKNAEKGITNLKKAGFLSPQALRDLPSSNLAELIHPCGYYNAKAAKLKAFVKWFGECFADDLEKMFGGATGRLREDLLKVHGIGEETADSILLYAGNKPIFVVDAYTRRIIDRIGIKPKGNEYAEYQDLFMSNLPRDSRMFNEYHALLVALGKNICRKKDPRCGGCCLNEICQQFKVRLP
jgi:endonuclease-3 related protein